MLITINNNNDNNNNNNNNAWSVGFTCSAQYSNYIMIVIIIIITLFVASQRGVMYMCFAESFVYTSPLLCDARLLPPLLLHFLKLLLILPPILLLKDDARLIESPSPALCKEGREVNKEIITIKNYNYYYYYYRVTMHSVTVEAHVYKY